MTMRPPATVTRPQTTVMPPSAQLALQILDEGSRFGWNGRQGRVIGIRPEVPGYLVFWDGYTPFETGVVESQTTTVVSFEAVNAADKAGLLQIHINDTMVKGNAVPRYDRTEKELRRMAWRHAYVQAAEDMIKAGKLSNRRRDF